MDKCLRIINWIISNHKKVVTILITVLTAILSILILIPGDQGEATIQSVIDFLQKLKEQIL